MWIVDFKNPFSFGWCFQYFPHIEVKYFLNIEASKGSSGKIIFKTTDHDEV